MTIINGMSVLDGNDVKNIKKIAEGQKMAMDMITESVRKSFAPSCQWCAEPVVKGGQLCERHVSYYEKHADLID